MIVQFPVPAEVGVIVTVDPDVEVPLPLQPPLATMETGSPELAVALTVNVDPKVLVPGSAKVMV